jgi:hypothetical protein
MLGLASIVQERVELLLGEIVAPERLVKHSQTIMGGGNCVQRG